MMHGRRWISSAVPADRAEVLSDDESSREMLEREAREEQKELEAADLSGRVADCYYCSKQLPSRWELEHFERADLDEANDSFYCGCRGEL